MIIVMFKQTHFHSVFWCLSGVMACAPPEFFARGEYQAEPTTAWQLGAILYRWLHGFKNSMYGMLFGKMQLSGDSGTLLSQGEPRGFFMRAVTPMLQGQ